MKTFNIPTKVVFEREEDNLNIGKCIKDYNPCFKHAFLIMGKSSLKKSGYYDKIVESLEKEDIKITVFNDVEPNPDITTCKKALKALKESDCDFVLACGGGSVIDLSKLICHGYYYSGSIEDIVKGDVPIINTFPLVTCLTLIASGSEMSNSCVISSRKKGYKRGFRSVNNYPLLSYLNPYLTRTMSNYQLCCGISDMFSHTFERYFSKSSEFEVSDEIALAVLKEVYAISFKIINKPFDVDTREMLMHLGTICHSGITSYMKEYNMPIHGVEHILTGKDPSLTHGEGIALLLPMFLEKNKTNLKEKIMKFGQRVFSLETEDVDKVIEKTKDFIKTLGFERSLKSIYIDAETLSSALNKLKV